jgi:vacuolar-type H+-ATPase subunit C/Vma6
MVKRLVKMKLLKIFNIMRECMELRKQNRFFESELGVVLGKLYACEREVRTLKKVIEDYKKQGWKLKIDD